MTLIRIIVADAQQLVADGLRKHFADEDRITIVGDARTGKALLEMLKTMETDIVLMDISMHEMDGIDTTRKVRQLYPGLKVIAHSALTDIEYVNSMLIEGARGYVVKGCTDKELLEAFDLVMDGGRYICPVARQSVANGYRHTDKRVDGEYLGLTQREREIIRLIAQERTNDEIAAALFVSTDTVKTHRKNLMAKLNVRSTAGLVKYAVDRCWV
ncbi:MAG: response regulator transcription factor [Flavobacteriales bacterium]